MEFEISDNGGKSKAINVTGPGGGYVQGAPRRARGARTLPSAALLSPLSPLQPAHPHRLSHHLVVTPLSECSRAP